MSVQLSGPEMVGSLLGVPFYPSDKVCKALVSSMEQPLGSPRRSLIQHAIDRPERWFSAAWAILAASSLIILWYSNGFFDWIWYWMLALFLVAIQIVTLGSVWYERRRESTAPEGIAAPGEVSIRSLRRVALSGDDSFAPPITNPYSEQAALQPTAAAMSFKVATPESRLLRGQQIMYGINLVLWAFMSPMLAILFFMGRTLNISAIMPWQMFGMFAVVTIVNMLRFVTMTQKSRKISVRVGADGVHWRKQSLPWSKVRGWCVFAMNPASLSKPQPNVIYALVGEHACLTWLTYPPYARSGEPGQQLAQFVQEHVNLPLRDLTPGALHISSEIAVSSPPRRSRLLAVSDRTLEEVTLPQLPVAVLGLAFSALILLGGILTPTAQQWYFGSQLTRLETATSSVHDPLTVNTLQWTLTTADAAKDFAFSADGYEYLSTTCCNSISLMAQPINDGLVEVTVHQQVNFDLNEAGILFRANADSNSALAFVVTPNGKWHLNRFPLRGVGEASDYQSLRYEGVMGGISAIHQGLNATNRLAVLMQGSSYNFFVNGQYVGGYRADDMPQSGQVGVFVGGANGPVTFSDMLIASA